MSETSAPEQNSPFAPVSTTARSVVERAMPVMTASRSSHIWPLMAFFFSGRSSVIVTTPPARSTWSVS
jgi:hypothetical protein